MDGLRNATIKSADISCEDTSVPVLRVEFDGKSWGVGYPCYSGHLAQHVSGLMAVAGSYTLRGCVGKPVRVEFDGNLFKRVYHFLDDMVCLDPSLVATV